MIGAWLSTLPLRLGGLRFLWPLVWVVVLVGAAVAFPSLVWLYLGVLAFFFVGGLLSAAVEIRRERATARSSATAAELSTPAEDLPAPVTSPGGLA